MERSTSYRKRVKNSWLQVADSLVVSVGPVSKGWFEYLSRHGENGQRTLEQGTYQLFAPVMEFNPVKTHPAGVTHLGLPGCYLGFRSQKWKGLGYKSRGLNEMDQRLANSGMALTWIMSVQMLLTTAVRGLEKEQLWATGSAQPCCPKNKKRNHVSVLNACEHQPCSELPFPL